MKIASEKVEMLKRAMKPMGRSQLRCWMFTRTVMIGVQRTSTIILRARGRRIELSSRQNCRWVEYFTL